VTAKVNKSTTLHRGRVFSLSRENVTLENGATVDLDIIRHPGASAMVPVSGQGHILMLRQYRHALGGFIWEIPAGTMDPGETPLECAKRELEEETGFSADTWTSLGEITPVPGYSDERIHLFIAADLRPALQDLDRDEVLTLHRMPLQDALEMISNGELQDGKTVCALLLAARVLDPTGGT
jgi:ADP-ribose pyrophosphatase